MYPPNSMHGVISSLFLALASGCPGGGGDTESATDGSSTTDTTTDTTESSVTDATDPTTPTGGPSVECPAPVSPGDFAFFGDDEALAVNFAEICSEADFPALHEAYVTDKFLASVYRPDVQGDWPDQDLPLIIFGHGNGHRYFGYDGLFSELTRLGFVVISLDFPDNMDVQPRGDQILCASRWFSSTWTESGRLDGSLIFAGHSRGGEAVPYAVGLPDPRVRRGGAGASPPRGVSGSLRAAGGAAAGVREGGARGLRGLRGLRARLRADLLPQLRRRAAGAVLLQVARLLSLVHGPADGRGRGVAGGPRAAGGGLPAVGALVPGPDGGAPGLRRAAAGRHRWAAGASGDAGHAAPRQAAARPGLGPGRCTRAWSRSSSVSAATSAFMYTCTCMFRG